MVANTQNRVLDDEDRNKALDEFSQSTTEAAAESTSIVPAAVFSAPADRVFGAQKVAVERDEASILRKITTLAAAAGEDWFYRFPVRGKGGETSYIEGPSIKCANNVARYYGNCDIDVRVYDLGDSYMFYARFMDLETGYSLVRPFRQRKGQKVMKTDAGRAEDIVFQIGASKAIRNVVNNALEFFTQRAMDEAKNSIIEKVGKKLNEYRDRVKTRLAELKIDISRVEHIRGRAAAQWIAADVAMTIAEIQAINDGMATADETYPIPGATAPAQEAGKTMNEFANGQGDQAKTDTATPPKEAAAATSSGSPATAQAAPGSQPAPKESPAPTESSPGAAGSASTTPPKTEKEYVAHANAWRERISDPVALKSQWDSEKNLRNGCNVSGDVREDLKTELDKKIAKLGKGG